MSNGRRRSTERITKKSNTLSILAGGGSGSGLIVWLDSLSFDPSRKLLLEAMAPWFAAIIGIMAPFVFNIVIGTAKYYSVSFFIWRAKKQACSFPDGDENAELKQKAMSNIREMESLLIELNTDSAKRILDISSSGG